MRYIHAFNVPGILFTVAPQTFILDNSVKIINVCNMKNWSWHILIYLLSQGLISLRLKLPLYRFGYQDRKQPALITRVVY